jgi:leucyl-tRNA synthetase
MVCKETLRCPTHGFLLPEETRTEDGRFLCTRCRKPAEVGRVEKMSKSKKNVVDPNLLLERYGADTTRLFCLFAAPPERDLEWSEQGVEGGFRFLNRVWRLAQPRVDRLRPVAAYDGPPDALEGPIRELYQKAHRTIRKVTRDIEERFHFNTAISAVMELVNQLYGTDVDDENPRDLAVMRHALESVVLLLSPVVPHFAEEIWEGLGHEDSVLLAGWPSWREDALVKEEVELVVQVNGKLRSRLQMPAGSDEETVRQAAQADDNVMRFTQGKTVRRVIVVPDKLVNIVV